MENAIVYITDYPGGTSIYRGPVYKSRTKAGSFVIPRQDGGDRVFPLAGREVEVYAADSHGNQATELPILQYDGTKQIRGPRPNPRNNPHIPTGAKIIEKGGVLAAPGPKGGWITVGRYQTAVPIRPGGKPSGPGQKTVQFAVLVQDAGASGKGDEFCTTAKQAMEVFTILVGKPAVYKAIQDYQIRQGQRVGVQVRPRPNGGWGRVEAPLSLSDAEKAVDHAIQSVEYDRGLHKVTVAIVRAYLPSYTNDAAKIGDDLISYRIALRKEQQAPRRRNPSWPSATEVQTLIFAPGTTSKAAKAWAKAHGFKAGKIDTSGTGSVRVRQHPPTDYMPDRFRTIPLTDGVQAVVGVPKRSTGRQHRRK